MLSTRCHCNPFSQPNFPRRRWPPTWGNLPDQIRELSYLETPTAYQPGRLSRCRVHAGLRRRDRINGMTSTRVLNQAGSALGLTLFLLVGCNAIVGLDKIQVSDHTADTAGS